MNNSMRRITEQEKQWLLQEKYDGVETPKYLQECLQIEQGMPVAYLIGNVPFIGCHIDLSYKPLIPRAETEYWVNGVIASVSESHAGDKPVEILDLFAGSGCIGIACLKHLPHAHVDFGELQSKNISQIKKNLALNEINPDRYLVHSSDVFDSLPQKQYDYILANPPYITRGPESEVQESVDNNEEHAALYADDDGLAFVYQLIDEAAGLLTPTGQIYIEFDPWQQDLLTKKLKTTSWKYQFLPDQYDKTRVLVLTKKTRI